MAADWAKRYGKAYQWWIGFVDAFVFVNHPDTVREVLKTSGWSFTVSSCFRVKEYVAVLIGLYRNNGALS